MFIEAIGFGEHQHCGSGTTARFKEQFAFHRQPIGLIGECFALHFILRTPAKPADAVKGRFQIVVA
jgi:hypothetical protein